MESLTIPYNLKSVNIFLLSTTHSNLRSTSSSSTSPSQCFAALQDRICKYNIKNLCFKIVPANTIRKTSQMLQTQRKKLLLQNRACKYNSENFPLQLCILPTITEKTKNQKIVNNYIPALIPTVPKIPYAISMQQQQSSEPSSAQVIASFPINTTTITFFKYPQEPDIQYMSIDRMPNDESEIQHQLKGLGFDSDNLYIPFLDVLKRVETHTSLNGEEKKISPNRQHFSHASHVQIQSLIVSPIPTDFFPGMKNPLKSFRDSCKEMLSTASTLQTKTDSFPISICDISNTKVRNHNPQISILTNSNMQVLAAQISFSPHLEKI